MFRSLQCLAAVGQQGELLLHAAPLRPAAPRHHGSSARDLAPALQHVLSAEEVELL